jgi:hypothetical protein
MEASYAADAMFFMRMKVLTRKTAQIVVVYIEGFSLNVHLIFN